MSKRVWNPPVAPQESDSVTADPEHILHQVLVFVKRKSLKAVRRHLAARRTVSKEAPLHIGDFDELLPEFAEILDPDGFTSDEEEALHKALELLDDKTATAVLRRMAGDTNREIAQAIELSEEAARQRVRSGLRRLKGELRRLL